MSASSAVFKSVPPAPTGKRIGAIEVLECCKQLIAEHKRQADAAAKGYVVKPLLLAVAVDERDRLVPLIREAFAAEEGLLIDCSDLSDTVALYDDPRVELPKLVETVTSVIDALNALDDKPGLSLVVRDTQVQIAGTASFEGASRAQKTLRALLASIFSVDLRASEFVGLVYPEDALDGPHANLVWPLLMQLPELLKAPASTTMVVFAGDASLDFERHCSGTPSLRHHISDLGLQTRRTFDSSGHSIAELGRFTAEDAPLVVLFLGAGASVVAGLPTGNELRNIALAHQTGRTSVDRHNYLEAVTAFYRQLEAIEGKLRERERRAGLSDFAERLTLERVLLEEQAQEHQTNSYTLRRFALKHTEVIARLRAQRLTGALDADPLVQLLSLQARLVLVTVNFDQIIEEKAPDYVRTFITRDEFDALPDYLEGYAAKGGLVPLLKLHGDIGKPDTIVANINQTESGLDNPRGSALRGLQERIVSQTISPWWYVGYSMRDLDLEDFWTDPKFADHTAEHWVSPFVDPAVRAFIESKRLPRWSREGRDYSLGDRVVTVTASDFYRLLLENVRHRW